MTRNKSLRFVVGGGAALLLLAGTAWAGTPWVHVRVEEQKGAKVSVNLPLSLVQVALEAAPDKIASKGRIHLHCDGDDLKIADLKKMWLELRATGDTELVSVQDDDETVRVSRKGDLIQVRVGDVKNHKPKVTVDVPVKLVDALFEGEGDELNLKGALDQLSTLRGDVVSVHDDDDHVRIWIDEQGS